MIRVLVAMENRLSRAAFTALLRQECDLEVVAETGRRDEVLPAAHAAEPDVAVLELGPDRGGGLSTAIRLGRAGVRSLLLTDSRQHGVLARVAAAGLRGIGFLTTGVSAERLVAAIRDLARGRPVVDAELVVAALTAPDSPLTPREHEVLQRLAEGVPVTEIAQDLGLSVGTVHNHLSRINGKIGARTRIEAVRLATDAGWL